MRAIIPLPPDGILSETPYKEFREIRHAKTFMHLLH